MSIFRRYHEKSRNVDIVTCAREVDLKSEKTGKKEQNKKYLYTRPQGTMSTKQRNPVNSSTKEDRFVDTPPKSMPTLSTKQLPANCPLITGIVPVGCRFHKRFFDRMLAEGVLSLRAGCPVNDVCELTELTKG